MTFSETVSESFPGSMPARAFVAASLGTSAAHGFTPANSLACVGTCRDEICQPFVTLAQDAWGSPFLMGGLAGMLFLGRTGLGAAHSHAPIDGARERYVYFAMTHIGIGAAGEPGQCARPTRPGEKSLACGALIGLHGQITQGQLATEPDYGDLEQSLLTRRLADELQPGHPVDLVTLTKLACRTIETDLARAIEATVDTGSADYCVFTGVQIHAPDGGTLIWPDRAYAVVDGERHELGLQGGA